MATLYDLYLNNMDSRFMNRSELIGQLSVKYPQLTITDVDIAVRLILDEISATLANDGRVEIRGFGSFVVHHLGPRLGRNPKSGESVTIPAKYVPHFRVGKELRERVNRN